MSNGRGNMVTYFGVSAGVLEAQRHHVASLIGDAHWASVGSHREELIRTLLESRLPSRFRVSEGFIVLCDGTASPQIDVLIWDQQNHGPLFQAGRFAIVPAEGVVGVIEIKSSLGGSRMRDAACAIVSAKRLVRHVRERPVFGGIFGYRSDVSIAHILDSIRNALGWVDPGDVGAFAPDIIAALDEPMATIIGSIGARSGEIPCTSTGFRCCRTRARTRTLRRRCS